jgi:hypothetical protein
VTAAARPIGYPRAMSTGRHLDAAPDAMRTPPVPLVDAARTLGCSRDAVRKRLDRGSLRGVKRHGQWYVYLDAADATVDASSDAAWTPSTGRVDAFVDAILDGADARWTPPDATPDTSDAVLAEVCRQRDQLEATVADLRGRLDTAEAHLTAAEQAQAELRRLLAAALQQRALPAPRDAEDPSSHRANLPRPWWARLAWWRH